jgi:hypothetical protein
MSKDNPRHLGGLLLIACLVSAGSCRKPAIEEMVPPDAGMHLMDAGPGDAGIPMLDAGARLDAALPDAGDAGARDAATVDSAIPDAARADAGEPDAGPLFAVTVSFSETSAFFPPTVNKIGFNSVWNSVNDHNGLDAWTIERAARYRAPMIAGLIEPKSLAYIDGGTDRYKEYEDDDTGAVLDAQECSLWQQGTGYSNALFFNNGGVVQARTPTDPDLASIRALANAHGLINFLQVAGTPGSILPIITTYDNGLFTLQGQPTTGGNWYPLPAAASFPSLAYAFGTFPAALGYATRTVYSFWQEPSHTLDEGLTAANSIDKYSKFFWQVGSQISAQCRFGNCPVAGAQLNANDGDTSPHDGYRYQMFMDDLRLRRMENPGVDIPLDYFTIQNYAAQWNANIIPNARLALGTDSNWTPVMMNEWDFCVNNNMGDPCTALMSQGGRSNSKLAWNTLHWLKDSIEYPDVSHVLVREKIFRDQDNAGVPTYSWVQVPVVFMASMSEFRRPVSATVPDVPIMASGDADQVTLLMWNEGAEPRRVAFSLRNLPTTLLNQPLHVKKVSRDIRDTLCPDPADVMDSAHNITCWLDGAAPITITGASVDTEVTVEPGEAVMVFAGSPPTYTSTVFANHFVRSRQLVKRDGTEAAPLGMGHFDPRTGSITVGTRVGGAGLARVLLANSPDTLTVTTRFASQGPVDTAAMVAGVRVDYLNNAHVAVKSVFFRDNRWTTAPAASAWTEAQWPTAPSHNANATNLCGTTCTAGNGTDVTLDILANAPAAWATTRDVEVGVVMVGSGTDATYQVDLP